MTEKEVLTATDEWISWLKRLYTCTSDENKKQTQKHIELLEKLRVQAERAQEWRDIAKWQNDEKLKMEKIALEYEKQNKRYREAIERALDESGWGDEGYALDKIIGILTKALEGDDD